MGINLRTYRRNFEEIALLWETKELTQEQKDSVKIFYQKQNMWQELSIVRSSQEKIFNKEKTEMAIISHKKNGLDARKDYRIKLLLGKEGAGQIEEHELVYEIGVLPNFEKDESRKNMHMYGYHGQRRKWAKLPVIEHAGQLAIPVVIIGSRIEIPNLEVKKK
jgi:hypothetical protein